MAACVMSQATAFHAEVLTIKSAFHLNGEEVDHYVNYK
jgi:hypothetical protein